MCTAIENDAFRNDAFYHYESNDVSVFSANTTQNLHCMLCAMSSLYLQKRTRIIMMRIHKRARTHTEAHNSQLFCTGL